MQSRFINIESNQVKKILLVNILALLAAYIIVFFTGLYYDDKPVLLVTFTGSILLFVPLWLRQSGKIIASIRIITFMTIGIFTIIATIGQGCHDISIFVFPVILFFASMTLSRSEFLMCTVLLLISIIWLTFGEIAGLFVTRPFASTNYVDFILLFLLMIIAAFAVDIIARNMRNTLEQLNNENHYRKLAEESLLMALERSRMQREVVASISISQYLLEGDVNSLITHLTEEASRVVNVERASVWMLTEDESELKCIDLYESSLKLHSSGMVLKREEFKNEFDALLTAKYIDADDPLTDRRTSGYVESYIKPLRITSMLDSVIRTSGKNIGVLCFEHVKQEHTWETDEITFSCQLTDQISITILNSERRKTEKILQNSQKLESLGILAGGIAHDFNNLMGGIFGYIDIAIDESKDKNVNQYLSKAINTIDRARGLTQQLLTFAKGGSPLMKTDNLFPFIQETIHSVLSGSKISFSFNISENLWSCYFDRNQIAQAIDNIVINAQQSMPEGGKIEVDVINLHIGNEEHIILPAGNYIKISIKDYGSGISPEIIPHIFDPFYTTKEKGHGLGLSTCYSIIKRHGGYIDVESEIGKGSTFHIYLLGSADFALSQDKQPESVQENRGTFIVMDNEEIMRDTIKDMLKSLGYKVLCTKNGREAIDFFSIELKENRRIEGIIFDLTIPGGMGGKEAISEIRKLSIEIPVFVTSGYKEDPVITNPNEYGFTASICKPFRKSELSKMINNYLNI